MTDRLQVRLLTRYAGPMGNYAPGMVIALPSAEADALVENGFAIMVDVRPVEAAVIGPTEVEKLNKSPEKHTQSKHGNRR